MTDFRALCAELYGIFEKYDDASNLAGIYWDMEKEGNDILDRARDALAEQESRIPKNCWLDEEPDLCPSPCVFDDPNEYVCNCMFATKLETDSKPKTDCKFYRQ